jgi:hypothetical protein
LRKLILAAALMALAVPAVASAAPTKTTLTYDGAFLANGHSAWGGKIKSANAACMNKRSVTVFKVKPGTDTKIGTGKSAKMLNGAGYFWGVDAVLAVKPGEKYYAMVKATGSCGGDVSNVRTYTGA